MASPPQLHVPSPPAEEDVEPSAVWASLSAQIAAQLLVKTVIVCSLEVRNRRPVGRPCKRCCTKSMENAKGRINNVVPDEHDPRGTWINY